MLNASREFKINEFHYDNSAADNNEFVEIVVRNAQDHDLSKLLCYLYNGFNGEYYASKKVSYFDEGSSLDNMTFYTWYPSSIQNGSPDGIAIVYNDSVVQCISYEGNFTASNGPCSGSDFHDIEVSETSSTSDIESCYLTGTADFTWTTGSATPGSINTSQKFTDDATPVELSLFTYEIIEKDIILSWVTESETEISAFILERNASVITEIPSRGTASSGCRYSFQDDDYDPEQKNMYSLYTRQMSNSIQFKDSLIVNKLIKTISSEDISLSPNPGNCRVQLSIMSPSHYKASIKCYNLSGVCVRTLLNYPIYPGKNDINLDMASFPSGCYIADIMIDNNRISKKFTLSK